MESTDTWQDASWPVSRREANLPFQQPLANDNWIYNGERKYRVTSFWDVERMHQPIVLTKDMAVGHS